MYLSVLVGLTLAAVLATPFGAFAEEAAIPFVPGETVKLPAPRIDRGMSLMAALAARCSRREFDSQALGPQVLGDLLWAAWGINRPTEGKHTAPSARNWQDMTVYVVLESGVFAYEPVSHALVPKVAGDHRAATGKQEFCATAPVNLVYVSDSAKLETDDATRRERYAGAHAGFISQNVYLFCASEGLATVVRAMFDEQALSKALGLASTQHPILAQTVGSPAAIL